MYVKGEGPFFHMALSLKTIIKQIYKGVRKKYSLLSESQQEWW